MHKCTLMQAFSFDSLRCGAFRCAFRKNENKLTEVLCNRKGMSPVYAKKNWIFFGKNQISICYNPRRFIPIASFLCRFLLDIQQKSGCNFSRKNDLQPPTVIDYIPRRNTHARMRNWSENDSFLYRNRFTNGKQLSH